jgi:hypothetical protein
VQAKLFQVPEPQLNVHTQIGTFPDVTQLETLTDLLRFREKTLYSKFITGVAELTKQGKSGY